MRDTFDTTVPPPYPPSGGREYYLPEVYYFFDSKQVPLDAAIRVTAICVAQWSDRFSIPAASSQASATESKRDYPGREGELPMPIHERQQAVQALIDWLTQTRGPLGLDLDLFAGDQAILFQDGVLFQLALSPQQFAQLQDCWQTHGLPRDLFYPASQQREVNEPVAYLGGVVNMNDPALQPPPMEYAPPLRC